MNGQKRNATFRWRPAVGRDSAPHRIGGLLRAVMDHDLEEVRVSRYHQGSDGLGAVVLIESPVLETRHAGNSGHPNRIAIPLA